MIGWQTGEGENVECVAMVSGLHAHHSADERFND